MLPYIKSVKAETSRVADLLAQVPAEIDIEAMVAKKLEINMGTPAHAAGGISYKAGAKSLRSLGNSSFATT